MMYFCHTQRKKQTNRVTEISRNEIGYQMAQSFFAVYLFLFHRNRTEQNRKEAENRREAMVKLRKWQWDNSFANTFVLFSEHVV